MLEGDAKLYEVVKSLKFEYGEEFNWVIPYPGDWCERGCIQWNKLNRWMLLMRTCTLNYSILVQKVFIIERFHCSA